MNKNIYYKEWTKTRLTFWVLLFFVMAAYIFEASKMYIAGREVGNLYLWQLMILKGMVPFQSLRLIPMLTGILIGVTQFVPELRKKRLKLSLHLPLNHLHTLGNMLGFGLIMTLSITTLSLGFFIAYSSLYYPREVIQAWILTAIPSIVCSCVAYLAMVWILIEPKWSKRIFNIIITLGTLYIFYQSQENLVYTPIIWFLILLIVLFALFNCISLRHFVDGIE